MGMLIGALIFFVYKLYKQFVDIKKGVEIDLGKKGFDEVRKRLDFLEEDGKLHSQKVSLVRYNPFRELGGDHSFCLAILDGHDTGVIITSLHTRDRTRVYMKSIKNGKSETQLSIEELKALSKAQSKK